MPQVSLKKAWVGVRQNWIQSVSGLWYLRNTCILSVCFHHSGFPAEFGSNKRGALKKNPQEILFSLPKLNTRLRMWLYMFVQTCLYLTSKAPFSIIKVAQSPYDVFFSVKEQASKECITSALSMRNCQKGSWEDPLTSPDLGFLICHRR